MANKYLKLLFTILILSSLTQAVFPQERFPHPEFESDYVLPETTQPEPKGIFLEYLDVVVLLLALALSAFLSLKLRSRLGIFLLMLFSLAYFGFFRQGCVCPVGSIQNVAYSLFHSDYIIPLSILIFFLLPLIFALFFGRVFCSSVCPLGAIQDIVALKPIKLPDWISAPLSLLPYLYLGLIILFAVTESAFILCRFDPFVSIFRLNGNWGYFIYGGLFLASGVFIARPYCRFMCPYGVLLNWFSRFSRYHLSIAPEKCIQCTLCRNACPMDAIKMPDIQNNFFSVKNKDKRGIFTLKVYLVLLPLLVIGFGAAGYFLHKPLSMAHPDVRLALLLQKEEHEESIEMPLEVEAFRTSGENMEELFNKALGIQESFQWGSILLGCFLGLVIGLKLIGTSTKREQDIFEPDKGRCLSCGRCFAYCPQEHQRRDVLKEKKVQK